MNDSPTPLHPDALFVVACPVCQGQIAATGSTCGSDACCPLCASLFRVPFPPARATEAESPGPADTPQRSSLGEDWEGVIEQLAPPRREADDDGHPGPPATFEPAAGEPSATAPEPSVATEASRTTEPSFAVVEPATASEALPTLGHPPVDAAPGELRFQEPIRTVRVGGEVIEIRRLSPEERRARRLRRTLLMIVVGISILLAIVVLAGFGR